MEQFLPHTTIGADAATSAVRGTLEEALRPTRDAILLVEAATPHRLLFGNPSFTLISGLRFVDYARRPLADLLAEHADEPAKLLADLAAGRTRRRVLHFAGKGGDGDDAFAALTSTKAISREAGAPVVFFCIRVVRLITGPRQLKLPRGIHLSREQRLYVRATLALVPTTPREARSTRTRPTAPVRGRVCKKPTSRQSRNSPSAISSVRLPFIAEILGLWAPARGDDDQSSDQVTAAPAALDADIVRQQGFLAVDMRDLPPESLSGVFMFIQGSCS